jgi:hypothetical protein
MKGTKSVEQLSHFRCGSCNKWWSIGDAPERTFWHCPWCGTFQEIFADSPEEPLTPPVSYVNIQCNNTEESKMKFSRGMCGEYPAVVTTYNGLELKVFKPESESFGWCLRVGLNTYPGYATRRAAFEAATKFV